MMAALRLILVVLPVLSNIAVVAGLTSGQIDLIDDSSEERKIDVVRPAATELTRQADPRSESAEAVRFRRKKQALKLQARLDAQVSK